MPCKIYSCGLEASVDIIGGKWKPLILWNLSKGPKRFGEMRRLVIGISEKMLIQQVRDLVSDGVVARKDFREIPPRVEYSLTEFGSSLLAALGPLCDWGSLHSQRIGKLRSQDVEPKGND